MITTLMACGATAVVCFSAGTMFGTSWATRGRDDYVDRLKRRIGALKAVNREMYRELSKLIAERDRRNAPLKAANAARHAKKVAREAEARAVREATHSGMRAKLEAI